MLANPALCWDTAMVTMQTRFEKSKLMLLYMWRNTNAMEFERKLWKMYKTAMENYSEKRSKVQNEDKMRKLIKKSSKLETMKGES